MPGRRRILALLHGSGEICRKRRQRVQHRLIPRRGFAQLGDRGRPGLHRGTDRTWRDIAPWELAPDCGQQGAKQRAGCPARRVGKGVPGGDQQLAGRAVTPGLHQRLDPRVDCRRSSRQPAHHRGAVVAVARRGIQPPKLLLLLAKHAHCIM